MQLQLKLTACSDCKLVTFVAVLLCLLFLHLNSMHLSCGQHPSASFLTHFQKEICPTCRVVKPNEKPCGSCLNRERKTLIRCNSANPPPGPPSVQQPPGAPVTPVEHVPPFPGTEAHPCDDFDNTLPQLQDIKAAPIPTFIHVPKALPTTSLEQNVDRPARCLPQPRFPQLLLTPYDGTKVPICSPQASRPKRPRSRSPSLRGVSAAGGRATGADFGQKRCVNGEATQGR